MDFEQSELERMLRTTVRDITDDYDRDYWRELQETQDFPTDLWQDLADHDILGVAIPERYGGQGLGVQEQVMVLEELGFGGAWPAASSFIVTPVFGGETLVSHGSEALKEEWLPRIADGDARWALSVTEPDAGLNTLDMATFAERDGEAFVIDGQKMWTSAVEMADRITVLTRTIPRPEADPASHGFTVFLVDPDDPNVEYEEIPIDGYFPEPTYTVHFDGVRVHESQVVGEVHQGLHQLFNMLNVERITSAAQAVAAGRYALDRATKYANEREVFNAPIGSHQAIQHPLADAYADLELARLTIRRAAWQYDNDEPAGTASNVAKLKGPEAAWNACEAAMSTYGGLSISAEMEISRIWKFVRHLRIIPISEEMLRNYIAENELGLPRSY
jgi:acyl-CoA dehydrogenase